MPLPLEQCAAKDVAEAMEEPVKVTCWGMAASDLDKDAGLEALQDEYVDARTPKKVHLPAEALSWSACLERTKDEAAPAYSPVGNPRSPAPALPPALPPTLQAQEPTAPPPPTMAHPQMVPLSLEDALNGLAVQDDVVPNIAASPTGPPRSPPPSSPPMLPVSLPASLAPSAPATLAVPSPVASAATATPKQLALPPAAMCWEHYSEATPEQQWLVGGTPGSAKAKVELSKLLAWSCGDESSQEDEDSRAGKPSGASRQSQQETAPEATPAGSTASWFPPGLAPPSGSPSHGSALHGTGRCRPCAWFWKGQGCQNEFECGHCHLCPEGEIKARKKAKRTIMRMGLATPKVVGTAEFEPVRALHNAFKQEALAPSDPESTAAPASDQGSTMGGPCSEQELVAGSEVDSPRGEALVVKSFTEPVHLPPGLQTGAVGASSIGSLLHGTSTCRPCAWFWKPVGCQSGSSCSYCHDCPAGAVKARKKCKQAMLRMTVGSPIVAGGLGQWGAFASGGVPQQPPLQMLPC